MCAAAAHPARFGAGLAAGGAELAGVAGLAAGAAPAASRRGGCGGRSSGRLLLCAHLVEGLGVDAAGSSGLIHAHKGHGRTGRGIGSRCLHSRSLCAHHVGGGAGRVHKGGAALQLLDHLLVFFAGFDAGHAEGDDLDAAQLAPLAGQLLIQSLGQLGGMAGQSRVADAHLTDAGEGGLQCGHHLGAHLAFQRVTGVLVFHISADIGVKQDGVDDAVAVLAEAADADVDVDAGTLIHDAERHGAGGAVLVAHQLLGVDVIDALVGGSLTAEAEPLADLSKHFVDVLGQTLAQQRGLGAGVVGVLAGLGAEVHHLALLHDESALALGHRHDGTVGDDVLGAVAVGRAPGDFLLSLDSQHLRRESTAVKVFFPLVAHHAGCCAQCRFDKTHKPYLLYLPVFCKCGLFSVYHKTRREKRKPLHFIPDGCRILPTNKYRGACGCRLRGSSRTSTL